MDEEMDERTSNAVEILETRDKDDLLLQKLEPLIKRRRELEKELYEVNRKIRRLRYLS